MEKSNEMQVIFDSYSENEAFARLAVAAFLTSLNPTMDEMADVKTAVSEAVTNAIIHGYENCMGKVEVICKKGKEDVNIQIIDHGVGIKDVEKAKEPFYTTKPDLERSGMGFAFMEAFMDDVEVFSSPGEGTKIVMNKKFGQEIKEIQ